MKPVISHLDQNQIKRLVDRYKIRRLAFFGSAVRNYQKANDVDVLVDFEGGTDFDRYFGLLEELEVIFGKKVDLVTYKGLNKYLKPYIKKNTLVVYERS